MTSETRIAYGSWVSRHGKLQAFRLYQAKSRSSIAGSLPVPATCRPGRAKVDAKRRCPPLPAGSANGSTLALSIDLAANDDDHHVDDVPHHTNGRLAQL